jgi:hypothetical protein
MVYEWAEFLSGQYGRLGLLKASEKYYHPIRLCLSVYQPAIEKCFSLTPNQHQLESTSQTIQRIGCMTRRAQPNSTQTGDKRECPGSPV